MSLIALEEVHAGYGDFEALHGVSVSVEEGETLAVVGANGAGKSTLLKVIAGLVRPTEGEVRYGESVLDGRRADRRVSDGISMVPEGRRIFPSLSVRENLLVGAYSRRPGPWDVATVVQLFPMLADKLDRLGSHLSGGEQQAVSIGRALMSNPRLLLLDEVSLGLAPIVVEQLYAELPRIRDEGITTLIVEQDVGQALEASSRIVCMLEGDISLEGEPRALSMDEIKQAYFGM
jgi:branched-chain amino acid transport system ATP-binding protein